MAKAMRMMSVKARLPRNMFVTVRIFFILVITMMMQTLAANDNTSHVDVVAMKTFCVEFNDVAMFHVTHRRGQQQQEY